MKPIALIGFMGSGKTTVGSELARALGRQAVDLDARIETKAGKTITEIFQSDGEQHFRALESAELACALKQDDVVISCGGGVIVMEENRALLASQHVVVVYLKARLETLRARLRDDEHRPLLHGNAQQAAARLLAERSASYEDVADHTIETDELSIAAVTEAVLKAVAQRA